METIIMIPDYKAYWIGQLTLDNLALLLSSGLSIKAHFNYDSMHLPDYVQHTHPDWTCYHEMHQLLITVGIIKVVHMD